MNRCDTRELSASTQATVVRRSLDLDQRHYRFKPPPSGGFEFGGWVQPRPNSLDAGSRSGGTSGSLLHDVWRDPRSQELKKRARSATAIGY